MANKWKSVFTCIRKIISLKNDCKKKAYTELKNEVCVYLSYLYLKNSLEIIFQVLNFISFLIKYFKHIEKYRG